MDWRRLLFSMEGRLSRVGFARGMLLAMIYADLCFISACLLAMVGGWIGAPALLLAPLCFVIQVSLTVRRLHDRNKPAWWAAVFLLVPLLAEWVGAALLQHRPLGGLGSVLLALLLIVAGVVLSCWYWIEMLFVPAVRGENRYGQDTLNRPLSA